MQVRQRGFRFRHLDGCDAWNAHRRKAWRRMLAPPSPRVRRAFPLSLPTTAAKGKRMRVARGERFYQGSRCRSAGRRWHLFAGRTQSPARPGSESAPRALPPHPQQQPTQGIPLSRLVFPSPSPSKLPLALSVPRGSSSTVSRSARQVPHPCECKACGGNCRPGDRGPYVGIALILAVFHFRRHAKVHCSRQPRQRQPVP